MSVLDKWRVVAGRLDERWAWRFNPWLLTLVGTLVIASICGVIPGLRQTPVAPWIALCGGGIAILGVFVSLRPVIRIGGIAKMHRLREYKIIYEESEWMFDFSDEKEQTRLDDEALHVLGPALIGFGTLLNSVSGLVS